jgi:hypothetical protein
MENEIKSTKVARELTKNPEVFFNEEIEDDSLNKRILCDDKSAKVAFISLFPELKNKISPA